MCLNNGIYLNTFVLAYAGGLCFSADSDGEKTLMGPVEGELVLFCQHADVSPGHIWLKDNAPYHWFKSHEARMTRNGHPFLIEWIAVCNECFKADVISKTKFIGYHAPWIGESPKITGVN